MALSWNEIKDRALKFSKDWAQETNEDAEAKSFLDAFFHVFDVSRKRIATFETRVKKLDNKDGYIDMLWKGVILIEMKSRGKNLDKAYRQATDYFPGLKEYDLPRYILVCDFERFRLYDLEEDKREDFFIKDFYKHVKVFGFIAGYQTKIYPSQDPVNIDAAERMGKLHDQLKNIGYRGHELEIYLVRLLFCLFAEDTSIFEKRQFQDYVETKTKADGSDLAGHLSTLFYILNKPREERLTNLDEHLNEFPYVNGKLFEENLSPASFDTEMRNILLECCALDWSKISPAIFGSMFQSVMNPEERRNLGAHYTSEKNILKLIKPLFLDELWKEFESRKSDKKQLVIFHKKIASLNFLDPACGCGNFLIITYRELRLLEIEVIKALQKGQQVTNVNSLINVDVSQFYGIEYKEFPARIAEVALWLVDHQMNMIVSEEFGEYYIRLPLRKFSHIVHGNALRLNWEDIIAKDKLNYILGNPPFIGKQKQTSEQREDMLLIFKGVKSAGVLDYVTAWYLKAAQYVQDTRIVSAFVSTNSISQGEQVSTLWSVLFKTYHLKIHFAHRTFNWTSEGRGKAIVHVVIVGFGAFDISSKSLYDYEHINGEAHLLKVGNINPYLISYKDLVIPSRTKPIANVIPMQNGSMPNDNGNLILSTEEREQMVHKHPEAAKYIKRMVGAVEFINDLDRYCLWLENINIKEILAIPEIVQRLKQVKEFRSESTREATRNLANFPALFGERRQPASNYIIAPVVSSVNRKYMPLDIYPESVIATNLCNIIPTDNLYIFGVLQSIMMMTWMANIGGRLKSDWRFTKDNVYNNFPWPLDPSEKQVKTIEEKAQAVIDIRADFGENSLGDMYNTLTMPPALAKAHQELDKAVDLAFRPQPFLNENKRMEFLFDLYETYTEGLFTKANTKKVKKIA